MINKYNSLKYTLNRGQTLIDALYETLSDNDKDDSGNLITHIWRTHTKLKEFNLSKNSMQLYRANGFDNIIRHCLKSEITHYDSDIINRFVTTSYNEKTFCKQGLRDLRKSAEMLGEFWHTGTLIWHVLSPWQKRVPSGEFAVAIEDFRQYLIVYGGIVDNSIRKYCNAMQRFLCFLEDNGFINFSDLSLASLSAKITEYIGNYNKGGLSGIIFELRLFFDVIGNAEECKFRTSIDFSVAIPPRAMYHREIKRGFDVDQINSLVSSVPTASVIGKRDYAMIRLAATTGLRACDVVSLKFENIDWHTKTITIVQSKTGQPVTTVLTPQVGNAIADYCLNARTQFESQYIFLTYNQPYRKLSADSIGQRVRKYLREIEIMQPQQDCGFHNFRRGLGNRLLLSHTSFEMMSESLGQQHPVSAKKYASTHNAELKSCAIPLDYVDKGELL
jgi:site-specific recombinase XerD